MRKGAPRFVLSPSKALWKSGALAASGVAIAVTVVAVLVVGVIPVIRRGPRTVVVAVAVGEKGQLTHCRLRPGLGNLRFLLAVRGLLQVVQLQMSAQVFECLLR